MSDIASNQVTFVWLLLPLLIFSGSIIVIFLGSLRKGHKKGGQSPSLALAVGFPLLTAFNIYPLCPFVKLVRNLTGKE